MPCNDYSTKIAVEHFECGHVQLLQPAVDIRNNTNRRRKRIAPIATNISAIHPDTHMMIHNEGPCGRVHTDHNPARDEWTSCQTHWNPPAAPRPEAPYPACVSDDQVKTIRGWELKVHEWWKMAVDYISVLHGIDERVIRTFQRIPHGARPAQYRLPSNLRGLEPNMAVDFTGPSFDFIALEEAMAVFRSTSDALDARNPDFPYADAFQEFEEKSSRAVACLEEDAKFLRTLHMAVIQCTQQRLMREDWNHEGDPVSQRPRPADPREPHIEPALHMKRCAQVVRYFFRAGHSLRHAAESEDFTMKAFDEERHGIGNRPHWPERDLRGVPGWEMVVPTHVNPDEPMGRQLTQRRYDHKNWLAQQRELHRELYPQPPNHGANAGGNGNNPGNDNNEGAKVSSPSVSSITQNSSSSGNKRKRTQQVDSNKRRKTTSNPDSSVQRESCSRERAQGNNQKVAGSGSKEPMSSGYDVPSVQDPETVPVLTSGDVQAYMDNTEGELPRPPQTTEGQASDDVQAYVQNADGEFPRRGHDLSSNWNVPNTSYRLDYGTSSSSSANNDLPFPFTQEFLRRARSGDTMPQPYFNPAIERVEYGFPIPAKVEAELQQTPPEWAFEDATPMNCAIAGGWTDYFPMQNQNGQGVLGVAALPNDIADVNMMDGAPVEQSFYDDHPIFHSFPVPESEFGAIQNYHNRVQGVQKIGMRDVGCSFDVPSLSRNAFEQAGGDAEWGMGSAWRQVYETGLDLASMADPTAKQGVCCGDDEGFNEIEL